MEHIATPRRDSAGRAWSRRDTQAVVAATVAILVLGGISLNTRSIWLDESISAGLGRGSWSSWWTGVAEDGGSQSLYFLAVRLTSFLGDDPWVIRLPSLLAAAAVPYPMYRLAVPRLGSRVAGTALVILAVSYSFITNAQEARSYTMLAALITWAWLLMDRALETRTTGAWVRWGVVAALTLYAQPLGMPILVGQGIWLLLDRRRVEVGQVASGFAVAALLSVPFAYLTLFEAGDHTSWLGTFQLRSFAELVAAAFGAQRATEAMVLSAAAAGLTMALAAIGSLPHGRASSFVRNNLLYVLWVAVPILILLVGSFSRAFLIARYAVPLVPATATLAAIGIERLRLIRPALGHAAGGAVVGLQLLRTVTGYGIEPVPWTDVEAYMAANSHPSDLVAFEPAYTQAPFEYATWLHGDGSTMARPMPPADGWSTPRHPNLDEYPSTSLAAPDGSLWIIVRLDEGRIPQILDRFDVRMVEVERIEFGEAVVVRYEAGTP